MSEKIEPALTAQQWSDWKLQQDVRLPVAENDDLSGGLFLYDDGGTLAISSEFGPLKPSLPALIAVANDALPDSDPRKITRETVRAMRVAHLEFGQTNEITDRLLLIADALESYLPPDPT